MTLLLIVVRPNCHCQEEASIPDLTHDVPFVSDTERSLMNFLVEKDKYNFVWLAIKL